jgi:predicted aldo/keto reductase-like oxidoreductase
MKYRTFGKLDWKPSALGFGAMRLPVIDKDHGKIDQPEAVRMIRYAIDHGLNYVDTAYPYHRGTSEAVVGQALQEGYRERVRLATKLPCWLVKAPEDFDRLLNEQLERLQTRTIDFYLLHSLSADSWSKVRDQGVLRWAEGALADGRIGYLGFSFHDKYEVFQEIVDASDLWTFCQIQYNYLDVEYQAGTRGLQYAANKGLAVVIMEPLRGGALARNIPPAIQALWDSVSVGARSPRPPADWALQWLWNQPEVSLVLSGMSTFEQVEQNLASADRSGVGTLTEEEVAVMTRARELYLALCPIPCTTCKYCLPCPQGVAIPDVLGVYNEAIMFGDLDRASQFYNWIDEKARGDACIECGECLEKCPQGIDIPEWMKKVHEELCQKQAA